eukprot:CAMPEP_0201646232 /NCGR_PEP_ID=MMETSP0493-20130528/33563_1 /ASSEMBLY_ACC=CAM_ASM_000838 /TAXON_ID=420259 /ORGANISM="Thalassiosira gravida, Strain GMp14c1" /LENGTH=52 /DNA_ID=CAMNT_0048121349 /DNA_START=298 /DNA_END=452 /DNA_ORIENTATION=-
MTKGGELSPKHLGLPNLQGWTKPYQVPRRSVGGERLFVVSTFPSTCIKVGAL